MSPVDGPAYPDDDVGADVGSGRVMGWGGRIALAAAMVAVVLIVVLHLTGAVGPGAH